MSARQDAPRATKTHNARNRSRGEDGSPRLRRARIDPRSGGIPGAMSHHSKAATQQCFEATNACPSAPVLIRWSAWRTLTG